MHGWRCEQEAAGLMVICRSVLPCSFLCSAPREKNDSLPSQRRELRQGTEQERARGNVPPGPPSSPLCLHGGISEKYLVQGQDSDKFGLQSHTNRTTDT